LQGWLNTIIELGLQTGATATCWCVQLGTAVAARSASVTDINNADHRVISCFDAHVEAYQLHQLSIQYLIEDFKHVQVAVGEELVPSIVTGHGHQDALAAQLVQQGHPPPSGGAPPLLIPILHIQPGLPKCQQCVSGRV